MVIQNLTQKCQNFNNFSNEPKRSENEHFLLKDRLHI